MQELERRSWTKGGRSKACPSLNLFLTFNLNSFKMEQEAYEEQGKQTIANPAPTTPLMQPHVPPPRTRK